MLPHCHPLHMHRCLGSTSRMPQLGPLNLWSPGLGRLPIMSAMRPAA